MNNSPITRILSVTLVLVAVLAATLPLVQRIPNGADHYFMIDVGEMQIVLNNWGTPHFTGYPHYTILGNLLTDALTLVGVRPATAAGGVSLLFGLAALALLYLLALHLTERPLVSAGVTLLFGLTRTVWIHLVIAEIYSFGLLLLVALLAVALWRPADRSGYGRIYWLALLGGVAVAHHRALAMVAPALVYAVWGELTQSPRRLPGVLLRALALGLIGFLPYVYLPLRAWMGADWVYGDPSTLAGLWEQFTAAEASRFIGLPGTWAGLWANIEIVNRVLITDLTLPGLLIGLAGLVWGVARPHYRRAAVTMLLSGGVAYVFHALYYTDVLSALILPVTLSVAFGWLFAAVGVLERVGRRVGVQRTFTRANGKDAVPTRLQPVVLFGVMALALALGSVLVARNVPFIRELVTDARGLETIATAETAPAGATLMLPWGPRHFAVGYARDIEGGLQHIMLVDHNADHAATARAGTLVVPEYVQYTYPLAWWGARLDADVYPQGVAPGLVALAIAPERVDGVVPSLSAVQAQEQIECRDDELWLRVVWLAPATALPDLTAFAHLLDGDGVLLAQDDHPPVYGWRPTSGWAAGEVVRDVHRLPRVAAGETIRYGLYRQAADGAFVNEVEREIEVTCGEI